MNVIGTVLTNKGCVGDFDWMIQSGQYEDALFLFDEDEPRQYWVNAGKGNAVIRKYNPMAMNRPRSMGVLVADNMGGYTDLTTQNRHSIDSCFHTIREICLRHRYTTLYYMAESENGLLNTSHPYVHPDVIQYITQQIRALAATPIVPPITDEAVIAIKERELAVQSVKAAEQEMCDVYHTV